MEELEILLLVAITGMGILLLILLHKITILKKQTDDIIQEVKAYVAFVTSDEQGDFETPQRAYDVKNIEGQSPSGSSKICGQARKEEIENHIIQAVLGEYFP